ncbi:unnamed protein product [Colias eurytheme]|nr:unnamed protein product [Colias eurytheme]
MLNIPFRYCSHMRSFNQGVLSLGCNSIGSYRNYSKDKGKCCPDVPQAEGKRVEPWPKSDPPPPAWRCECPREPQPPNYDPYRIKVPDVVVPPLPPSNAKWTGVLWTHQPQHEDENKSEHHQYQHGYQQGYQQQQGGEEELQEKQEESGGFFGFLKNLFGRGKKSGRGEGEMSMIGTYEYQWCYAR